MLSVVPGLARRAVHRFAGGVPLGPVHHHDEYPAARLAALKGDHVVSVCLPARNEAATIGAIVGCLRDRLVDEVAVVDEILVVDDHSSDGTAAIARAGGATVVSAESVLADYGEGHGKGEALWKSLFVARGDLLVWCDSDIVNFDDRFVRGLLGPLLEHPEVGFVKGFYHRPQEGMVGGGRVTELLARPLLSLFFPELSEVVQPLAGEFAARRTAVEQVPFVEGYGVDIALVLDLARTLGPAAIAQVDLDERVDRNRSLEELGPQALAVAQAVLRRAGVAIEDPAVLRRPVQDPVAVTHAERPPMVTVPAYRDR